jgi:hypothetical protein
MSDGVSKPYSSTPATTPGANPPRGHTIGGPARSAGIRLGSDRSGFPKRLFVAIGAILIVGLGITVLVVHASDPGWPTLAAARSAASLSELPDAMTAPPPADPVPQPAVKSPILKQKAQVRGPSGRVTVPSAGLRTHPSLTAKAMSTVVKKNERVTILARVSADSGPEWLKIATSDGNVGWVWASVVREEKGKKRT